MSQGERISRLQVSLLHSDLAHQVVALAEMWPNNSFKPKPLRGSA